MPRKPRSQFDGAWKEILTLYFEDFVKFFFPYIHEQIVWSAGFVFLDKELNRLSRNAAIGSKVAAKLVKVQTKQYGVVWALIHIEIHGQQQADFAEHIFTYYYKLFDAHKMKVASLVILIDANPSWRPAEFNTELFDCRLSLKFPVIKLSDYKDRREELESGKNPFAIVVLAHLAIQEAGSNLDTLLAFKRDIVRRLYSSGYDTIERRNFFNFIDLGITLPNDLELHIKQDVQHYEEDSTVKPIGGVTRLILNEGIEQGLQQGRQEGFKLALELKFGKAGLTLLPIIAKLKSAKELNTFQSRLKKAETVDGVKKFYH
jgi:hypothetical protein